MCLLLENNIDHLRYLVYLIQSSVHVINQHQGEQFVDVEVIFVNKGLIDKNTGGSKVDKYIH